MSAPVTAPARSGPAPFPRLVRVELRRSLDTAPVPVLLLVVLGLGVAAAVYKAVAPGPEVTAYREIGVAMIAAPLLGVLGAFASAAEWGDRTVCTSFLLEPRRGRVLAARAVVAVLLGLAVAVLLVGSALLVTALAGSGPGAWAQPGTGIARGFGFVLVPVLSGFALGALIQQVLAAAVVCLLVPSLGTTLVGKLLGEGLARWIDPTSTALAAGPGMAGPAATAALLWIVTPLALGAYRWSRRDVS